MGGACRSEFYDFGINIFRVFFRSYFLVWMEGGSTMHNSSKSSTKTLRCDTGTNGSWLVGGWVMVDHG